MKNSLSDHPAISVENITRTYRLPSRTAVKKILPSTRKIIALDDVSLQIRSGQVVGLIGLNGSGKSSLIKILCGIIKVDSGRVSCLGYDPFKQRKSYVRHIGAVFGQKSLLFPDLSLVDSLNLYRAVYGLTLNEYDDRLEELSQFFGVNSFLEQPVRKLSFGQRMRGDLLAAFMHNPQLLFLDEPGIGLDVLARSQLTQFLKNRAENNHTIFIVTHDLDMVSEVCTQLIIMKGGKKVLDRPISEIQLETPRVVEVTYDKIHDPEKLELAIKSARQVERESPYQLSVVVAYKDVEAMVQSITSLCRVIRLDVKFPPLKETIEELLAQTEAVP